MTRCVNCCEFIEEEGEYLTETADGLVCKDCLDNDYSYCEECGNFHMNDDMRWFNESCYCDDCYHEVVGCCEECGCEISRDELVDVGQNVYRWVCPDCVNEHHTCNECGGVVESLTDSGMCEGCFECNCDSVDNIIESYNYKPDPIFFGEGDRFFGVELETEPRDEDEYGDVDMVREVQSYVSEWGYLKHDGSLLDGGFELVTHPMTLAHHLEKFTPELFDTIRRAQYVSHTNGNCGLHIHISRTAFKSDLAIVKILEFIYGNYDSVVSKLGRRGSYTRYCMNNKLPSSPTSIGEVFESNNRDRYHAVNTKNDNTIELRFFRGTLTRDTFVSALQFADALINVSNKIEDIDKKIEWSDVFLEVERLGYKELEAELIKRLDVVYLASKDYEGYKLEEGEEEEEEEREDEISTHLSHEPITLEWTGEDMENNRLDVLEEFNRNYVNRYQLDNQPINVPSGTLVQIMPLTMMECMRRYSRFYPSEMDRFAGSIYRLINCGEFYRLEDGSHYTWDRSSFRILSEPEEEGEISPNTLGEPVEIEWTEEDMTSYSLGVLEEFGDNYINRYQLDRQPTYVTSGTLVQIMPLTMMKGMRLYGRNYPREMDRFAGGIYKVINFGGFFRLEGDYNYTWNRSSFRILSEQEVRDISSFRILSEQEVRDRNSFRALSEQDLIDRGL